MMDDYRNDPDYIDQQFDATPDWVNARSGEYDDALHAHGGVRRARRGSTTDTLDAFAHRARTSPLSLAMVAVGVAGLLMNHRPRGHHEGYDDHDYDDHDYRMRVGPKTGGHAHEPLHGLKSRVSHAAHDLGDKLEQRAEPLRHKAAELAAEVGETLSSAREGLRETASEYADEAYRTVTGGYKVARNRAAYLGRKVPERGAHLVEETGSWVRENPVPLALSALALGAVAATFVTYKRRDDGDYSDGDYHRDRASQGRFEDSRRGANAAAETAATRDEVNNPPRGNISAAIPAGKTKLGENVVESTSVLGVAENEKKS